MCRYRIAIAGQAERMQTILQHTLTASYMIAEWCRKNTFNFIEIVNRGGDGEEYVNSKTY